MTRQLRSSCDVGAALAAVSWPRLTGIIVVERYRRLRGTRLASRR